MIYRLRNCFVLILLVFLLPLNCVLVKAESSEGEAAVGESVTDLIEELDLSNLEEYIASLKNFSNENLLDRLLRYMKGEGFSFDGFFKGLFSTLFENVKSLIPAFSCIIAIALLCGILSSIKSNFIGNSTADLLFLLSFLSTLIPVLSIVYECFTRSQNSVLEMHKQMEIIFPLLLTLMVASGGNVSVAIYRPAVAFLSATIVRIIAKIVFPIALIVIAFSIAGNLSEEIRIKKFGGFFKSMNKWIIGVSVSVYGMFFTVQGLTASSYDGIARRATKYALGTGVPIVGGFLSGGFDLAMAGSILIKNSLGLLGIFMMIAVLFEPLVLLISANLLLRLTAAITEPIGDKRISTFLSETADNLNYCMAGLLFVGFLYFITIVLVLCSGEVLL